VGCDVEEPVIEPLQPAPGFSIGELTPVHLQEMAGGSQGLVDSRRIRGGGGSRNRHRGKMVGLGRMPAGEVELALEVHLGHLHIPQGHANVVVAQQLHQSRKSDAEADHLRGEAVP
jgi:hypothetical protein